MRKFLGDMPNAARLLMGLLAGLVLRQWLILLARGHRSPRLLREHARGISRWRRWALSRLPGCLPTRPHGPAVAIEDGTALTVAGVIPLST
ncbi:hypothetical protein GCM10027580_17500 [Corynebacterium faecale]